MQVSSGLVKKNNWQRHFGHCQYYYSDFIICRMSFGTRDLVDHIAIVVDHGKRQGFRGGGEDGESGHSAAEHRAVRGLDIRSG